MASGGRGASKRVGESIGGDTTLSAALRPPEEVFGFSRNRPTSSVRDMEGTLAPALDQPTESDAPETPELIADELLVEEISIDGMCGVY